MAELSLYRLNADKVNKSGDTFSGQIISTVSDKAPIVLDPSAANYIINNLNADKLDGYNASAFLQLTGGTVSGVITSNVSGTISTGSAPFVVASSKKVVNLNSDLLDDMSSDTGATANTIAARDGSGNLTANVLVSKVDGTTSTGTAPFTVASSKVVPNLNSDLLDGLNASDFPLKVNPITGSVIVYEQVAMFTNELASQIGTLKITLPKSWSNTMLNIIIKVFDNSTNGAYELILGGYNNPGWSNCTASSSGSCPFTSVRFGHDGVNCCILLGTTTTTWQYPKIYIDKVIAGFSSQAGWGTGWSIGFTTESGINISATPTINTGLNVDTLDGKHAGDFATKIHNLIDTTNHPVSGLTANNVLTAITGTTYGFSSPSTHGNHVPATAAANNAIFLRNDNSWATVTPANIGAAPTSHGNHVPATQASNNTTFLRNDNTWYQVTLTDLGAAPVSHGNHVPTTGTLDNKTFLANNNTWQVVTPANIGAAPSGYGLGTTAFRLTAGTDLNTVSANGWYDVSSPVNGVPTAVSGVAMTWHNVLVIASADTNFITQIAFPMSDGVQNSGFIRQKKTGTWGNWIPLTTILDTSTAGYFDNTATAPTSTWTNRLNWGGVFYAAKVYNAVYNDYAEYFLKDDVKLEAGDVVVKNPYGEGYVKSRYAFDKLVVGVYSDDYGQCIGGNGDGHDEENFASVGMAGRVRAKVTGNIFVGDLIVASDIPGVAMACSQYTPGTVIGKALETHSGNSIDRIQILISNM